jgi:flavin-binding protein dodecin
VTLGERRTVAWAAAVAGCLLGLVGCSTGGDPASGTPTPSGSGAGSAGTVAPGDTTEAVPGGAAVIVPPGSPQVCGSLARSAAVRDLGRAFADLADPAEVAAAEATLRDAATDLRALATDAVDDALAGAMRNAADTLDRLDRHRLDDVDAVEAVDVALRRLGEEVQEVCGFPVG